MPQIQRLEDHLAATDALDAALAQVQKRLRRLQPGALLPPAMLDLHQVVRDVLNASKARGPAALTRPVIKTLQAAIAPVLAEFAPQQRERQE